MKNILFYAIAAFFLLPACNNKRSAASGETATQSRDIVAAPLPRAHAIIDDIAVPLTDVGNPQSVNGFNANPGEETVGSENAGTPKLSTEALMKRKYKNLLVFHADDTMKIKRAYMATLILGKDQVLAELKEEVLDASNAKDNKFNMDTTLEIGTAMRAKLKDFSGSIEKGFDIDFLGDDGMEQRITEKRQKLMWQWKITPLTPGEQKLSLSIIITEKNGEKVNLPVRSIPIVIYAEEEAMGNKIMGFFERNIQWILATLLVPLFLGWYNARLRHKFDKKTFETRQQNDRPPGGDSAGQQTGSNASS
jgi:hypothetical protein